MSLGNEFWAAMIGAVVGGLIAFAIQMISLHEVRKQRADDQYEKRKALAHSILFKMLRIHTNLLNFHKFLEESFHKAAEKQLSNEPWKIVRPLATLPKHVYFSDDEKSLILSLDDFVVFNSIASMDEIHNNHIELFLTYGNKRSAMTSKMPAKMKGMVGTTTLSKKDMLMLESTMSTLNELIEVMRPQIETDYLKSCTTSKNLHILLTKNTLFTQNLKFDKFEKQGTPEKLPDQVGE